MDRRWAQPPAPRHQVVLFTETLDDAIPQNHPIRLLEHCLDGVDWTLWENRYDGHRGQPPIHPRLVAGCILYGLMQGLRTTRTLEDATANRLDFMWFLERRTIDHSTFADFRVEFKKELKDLNRQISRIVCEGCMDALLELVVDGARLRANSGRHGARTAQALDRLIAACEKELNEKLEKLAGENSEENLEKTDAETLAKGVAALEPEDHPRFLPASAGQSGAAHGHRSRHGDLQETSARGRGSFRRHQTRHGRSALSPAWAFGAFSCAASKKCEPNGRGFVPPSI